jgi:hypothetical protein
MPNILVRDMHLRKNGGLEGRDYDLCDDQTLSSLQTAINQTTAYRYGALPLR